MSTHSLRARFKEAVAEAILDAAEQLAADVGLQNAGLQGIAQRAGVSVGTIYNHFSDRNELFAALFKRLRAELITSIDTAMETASKKPFAVQLDTFVRTVLTLFDDRRTSLRVLLDVDALKIRAQDPEPPAKAIEDLRLRAERIVRVGVKEKRLRSEGSDLFPLFLVATLRSLLITRVEDATSFASQTDAIVAFFLNGAAR